MKTNSQRAMSDAELIDRLENWLKREGNSKAKLAALLGYETSETITRWIERGHVAYKKREEVIAIIKEKK